MAVARRPRAVRRGDEGSVHADAPGGIGVLERDRGRRDQREPGQRGKVEVHVLPVASGTAPIQATPVVSAVEGSGTTHLIRPIVGVDGVGRDAGGLVSIETQDYSMRRSSTCDGERGGEAQEEIVA